MPYGGFQNFQLKLEKFVGSTENLPVAHTCFNQLDLPLYESKSKLKDKLEKAVEYASSGFYIC